MTDIAGIINKINDFTQTMGVIQGAAEAFTPAVYQVSNAVNQVASVFTEDQYQPPVYPVYPVYPPSPMNSLQEGKVGLVTSLLSGGTAGALTYKQAANAIEGIKAGAPGAGKALGMVGLKAGGIGAALTGVVSAAKNMSLVSQGLQTSADAAGNISADTIGGLLTGATGGLTAGFASKALASMVPGGGIALTIGSAVAGAIGATGVHLLYNGTGIRDGIANAVKGMFGGGSNQYPQYPQTGYPQTGYPQQYPNTGYYYPTR